LCGSGAPNVSMDGAGSRGNHRSSDFPLNRVAFLEVIRFSLTAENEMLETARGANLSLLPLEAAKVAWTGAICRAVLRHFVCLLFLRLLWLEWSASWAKCENKPKCEKRTMQLHCASSMSGQL
jgi:hypothetical protein